MKVLLLSCDTGCGHNSAARAICEELTTRGIEHELLDPLTLGDSRAGDIASDLYTKMLRDAPGLFGKLYKLGDCYSKSKLTSPIYLANKAYADRLYRYIEENHFDRVISTHLFPMEATTALKKEGKNIRAYGVLTDYTCVPFFDETRLDGYFIPHEDLRHEMILRGMPDSRIFVTGIPVAAKFADHVEKSEARRKLGIPKDKDMLLIMSGGVGCGQIPELCDIITRARRERDFVAYVLVGRNNDMKEELDRRFGVSSHICTVPFTTDVNLYMNAADAMISKPGGLTSTEAAVAGVPLVQLLTYTACEEKNIEFFAERKMSIKADSPMAAAEKAFGLIDNHRAAELVRRCQSENIFPDAASRIVSKVIE